MHALQPVVPCPDDATTMKIMLHHHNYLMSRSGDKMCNGNALSSSMMVCSYSKPYF